MYFEVIFLKRQLFAVILSLLILCSSSFADVIYENSQSRTLTRGVTHTYIEKLAESGWQKINVIKADLTDSNVDVDVIYSSKGISYKSTVLSLAKENDAVAAVNADFFDMTIPSGRTSPLGLTVSKGEVISSPSHDNMLAALAKVDGKWLADYFSMQLKLKADNGNSMDILHINKFHSTSSIVMFTPAWGSATPAAEGACEMTVIDGVVTALTENSNNTVIPENGYVLRVNPKINNFFAENFKVGDNAEISLEIYPSGDIENSIGGGSVLCSNGKIHKFTNEITGKHPRTAAGVSEDGKMLYLVTVEGRESNTPGMTQTELANLMLSLGAFTAINFDGGGSTEMVARDKQGGTQIINTPSEGTERAISTALGVKATGTDGVFSSMEITLSKDIVFCGDYVEVWTTPLDNYYNPVLIDGTLSYAADSGYFVDNKYYPVKKGEHEITVTCQDITAKITVKVTDDLKTLLTYPSSFAGTNARINVIAIDSNGFRSDISPQSVSFDITGDGTVNDGEINCNGSVTVAASFKNKTAYCYGNNAQTKQESYSFDIKQPTLLLYPDKIFGSVKEEKNIVRSGKSACLSYDFNNLDVTETKAVYMNFNKDIPLSGAKYITMWVYGDNSMQWLRAQIDGSDGTVYRETIAENIDFEGWKYIEYKVPEKASSGYLSRIYLVGNDAANSASGKIYVDDITVLSEGANPYKQVITDYMMGRVDSPTFTVMPRKPDRNCFLNIITGTLLEKNAKKYDSDYAFGDYQNAQSIKNMDILYKNGSAFIHLQDTTPYKKYANLLNLETNGLSSVFIFTDSGIIDESEKRLFDNTMKKLFDKGINLFVISEGSENSSDLINGVRYLTIKNKPEINLGSYEKSKSDVKIIVFYVDGKNVTYEFKSVL